MNRKKFRQITPLFQNACRDKKQYDTRREAWGGIDRLLRSPRYQKRGTLHVYQCDFCGKFHIGNK